VLYARDSLVKDAMIKAGHDQAEAQSGCPIGFTYSKQQVMALLEGAGFRGASNEQDHVFPFVIEKYTATVVRSHAKANVPVVQTSIWVASFNQGPWDPAGRTNLRLSEGQGCEQSRR
jgi:hypothetical protein